MGQSYRISKFIEPLQKLDRAAMHIRSLTQGLDAYSRTISPELERLPSGASMLFVQPALMPADFPLTIGDAVHNLAATLDCLVSQLIAEKTGNPNKRIYFPTHETVESLAKSFEVGGEVRCGCGGGTVTKKGPNAVIRQHVPELERLIMETFQPAGESSILWQIKKADNVDKHNMLIVMLGECRVFGVNFVTAEGSVYRNNFYSFPPGMRVDLGFPGTGIQITDPGRIEAVLGFGGNVPMKGQDVVGWLQTAHQAVGGVLVEMERAFGNLIPQDDLAN